MYSRNSGCSAPTHSGSQVAGWSATLVVQPDVARRRAIAIVAAGALVDDHVLDRLAAAQRERLVDDRLQRQVLAAAACSSAVMTITAPASSMRSRRLCAEKPPKTTECVAPIRAQACIAATPSTLIGM